MNNDNRVYFIGAGASKQDRFPLTNELKHGIAWAILKERSRFESLAAHLQYLYNVKNDKLEESARIWEDLKRDNDRSLTEPCQVPDVTDLLSTLDWMIREQSSFGPSLETSDSTERSLAGELAGVRDLVVQALCYCLGTYDTLDTAFTTRNFIQLLRPGDSLITTNWDLLLDAARDRRFGSEPQDYGTTGNVVLEDATDPRGDERPKLLKLHGSLSWRYCQRCQRLVINPLQHVAGERQERAICLCTCRFSELIVTPGFVRQYRNVHLLNIWHGALRSQCAYSSTSKPTGGGAAGWVRPPPPLQSVWCHSSRPLPNRLSVVVLLCDYTLFRNRSEAVDSVAFGTLRTLDIADTREPSA